MSEDIIKDLNVRVNTDEGSVSGNVDDEVEFVYSIVDDQSLSVGRFKATFVEAENDAPVVGNDVFDDAVEDQVYEFTAASLLANDTDPEGTEFQRETSADLSANLPKNHSLAAKIPQMGDSNCHLLHDH